mmetsp:Transcript_9147/g.14201  ORF Transcript_9147/g.14201 Transcript_9147/m.14201 type:complete len:270 (-) Transcript_9147:249-1058(-)
MVCKYSQKNGKTDPEQSERSGNTEKAGEEPPNMQAPQSKLLMTAIPVKANHGLQANKMMPPEVLGQNGTKGANIPLVQFMQQQSARPNVFASAPLVQLRRPHVPEAVKNITNDDRNLQEKTEDTIKILPPGYVPTDFDVICGKGLRVKRHPGNIRFRTTIRKYMPEFQNARSKLEKGVIYSNIMDYMQKDGGFVKQDKATQRWYEVSENVAREKIGQGFRDLSLIVKREMEKLNKVEQGLHLIANTCETVVNPFNSGKVTFTKTADPQQ